MAWRWAKRPGARQASPMWVNSEDLVTSDGHPFFERQYETGSVEVRVRRPWRGCASAFYRSAGPPDGGWRRRLSLASFHAPEPGGGAGPFDAVADAIGGSDRRWGRHERYSTWVKWSGSAERSGLNRSSPRRCLHRRDDVGSERRLAEHRAAGTGESYEAESFGELAEASGRWSAWYASEFWLVPRPVPEASRRRTFW